jgi:hypothetical protein
MNRTWRAGTAVVLVATLGSISPAEPPPIPPAGDDPARTLVGRLELQAYKATIKGLTAFGDRREGTDRNRAAMDWIEAQLKRYGCTNIERLKYEYQPRPQPRSDAAGSPAPVAQAEQRPSKGFRRPTGPNTDANKQPDPKLRELDSQPSTPGPREEIYCTKVGSTRPGEMYIIGGHMDGRGYGEAANDDGSGTAIVMELARIFSAKDVQTERSIRFILWNNEETALQGARAYVEQRRQRQGIEDPPGSGKYPEPKWLGVIEHDMMLFDHGMPHADGSISPEQRPEADVNIEYAGASKAATESQALAWVLKAANDRYATDYPAVVGDLMMNTDSMAFQDLVPSVSLREAERLAHIGAGWDPHWHQPTDLFASFTDKDFRLGLNAAQTTLAALVKLAGAKLK